MQNFNFKSADPGVWFVLIVLVGLFSYGTSMAIDWMEGEGISDWFTDVTNLVTSPAVSLGDESSTGIQASAQPIETPDTLIPSNTSPGTAHRNSASDTAPESAPSAEDGITTNTNAAVAIEAVYADSLLLSTASDPGRCVDVNPDCVDLGATVMAYDGIWETGTGDSVVMGGCIEQIDSDAISIIESGVYQMKLNWYDSAGKMVLALLRPYQTYIDTYHGTVGEMTYQLGYLDAGAHVVFGNAAFWHGMGFGPYDSSDASTYQITQSDNTTWDIHMDEGVHLDSMYDDASLTVSKVADDCNVE